MKKIVLFFIIFLSSLSFIYGQNNQLYLSSKNTTVYIKYSNFYNKQVIDRIAKTERIIPQNMQFSYKVTFREKIIKSSVNQLKIVVRLRKVFFPTIKYKKFELPEECLPNKIFYLVVVYKKEKKLQTFIVKNNLLEGQVTVNFINDSIINKNQQYTIVIKNITINYNNKSVSNFNSWANLVDNYYQASNKSNKFYNKINTIATNPNALSIIPNLDKVYDYNALALKSIDFVRQTKQRSFYKTLVLNRKDPKKLANNLDNLFQQSSALHASCTEVINEIDLIYFDRGNKNYRYHNYHKALFYFNKSIDANPNYTPSYYMIAEIDYNMGDFDDCENILKNILLNIRGDANTLNKSAILANNLYKSYLSFAEKEISIKNYDKALNWLYQAQKFCNSVIEVNCNKRLDFDFMSVYVAKMNLMLANVDNSIKNFQMQNAESYLHQAINFKKAHIQFLKDDKPLIDRSMSIYEKYISLGNSAKKNKDYKVAINDYNSAKIFCTTNQYVQCSDDIDALITNTKYEEYNNFISNAQTQYNYAHNDKAENLLIGAEDFRIKNNLEKSNRYNLLYTKVKQKQYYKLINLGLSKKKKSDYQGALTNFTDAQKIETVFSIKKNYNLKNYIKDDAKKLILQKINKANENVKQNNLQNARAITQQAKEISEQYNLMNDSHVNSAFSKINSKIFSRECMNYKSEFNSFFLQAQEEIVQKNYLSANDLLERSKNISYLHKKCRINTAKVDKKIEEIKSVVNYLKAIELAKSNYNRRDYSSAISTFNKAIDIYESKAIASKFGIQAKTLNEFISQGSNEFVLYGAGYFLSNNSFQNALSMLNLLKSRGYKRKNSKYVQVNLGEKLAVRDHDKMASANPKLNVLKYTFNDMWFKYLRRAYLKTWRKL